MRRSWASARRQPTFFQMESVNVPKAITLHRLLDDNKQGRWDLNRRGIETVGEGREEEKCFDMFYIFSCFPCIKYVYRI